MNNEMTGEELCTWLRNNGSSTYRPRLLAADLIESQGRRIAKLEQELAAKQSQRQAAPATNPPGNARNLGGADGQAFDYSNQPAPTTAADGDQIPF